MKYFLLSFLLFSQLGLSLELYRYKDENGKWAFTDKKPEKAKNEEKTTIKERRKQELTVKLEKYEIPNGVVYKARNELYAPVEFVFKNLKTKNVKLDRDISKSQILPANSITTVLKAQKIDDAGFRISFSYSHILGDPNSQAVDNYVYGVPFAKGTKYYIGQAFNGSYSHSGKYNRYAVDLSLPVGTHILAARSGRVIDVAFSNFKAGIGKKFLDKANVIRILHDDGSMATYAHLKWEGIRVRAGEHVNKGEYIGDSGNTGYSTGAHLHFVIHANRKNGIEAIPFKFAKKRGASAVPVAGKWLKSE